MARISRPGLPRQVDIKSITLFESMLQNGASKEELFRYVAITTAHHWQLSGSVDNHRKKASKEQMRERLRAKLAAKTK
jgi:hypothetical protein